jgi:hypothetical protein
MTLSVMKSMSIFFNRIFTFQLILDDRLAGCAIHSDDFEPRFFRGTHMQIEQDIQSRIKKTGVRMVAAETEK